MSVRLGVHPDVPDHRDRVFDAPAGLLRALPRRVDLRGDCPPVYTQHQLNACSANAIAGALWYDEIKQRRPHPFAPSRLFLYYNERAREGSVGTDAPVSLRVGYKTVAANGVCPETMWPYDIARFRRKPPAACYRIAKTHPAIGYYRIAPRLPLLLACLAQGYPFVMGLSVHQSLTSPRVRRTGVIPVPSGQNDRMLGGHAVLVVGYSQARRYFLIRNSWGRQWGREGYGFLPFNYATHPSLAWDFWTVRRVG
jgi:C1A family cysteine protease